MNEHLIVLGKELGKAGTSLAKIFADKKVSFFEKIQLAIGLSSLASCITANYEAIRSSIEDDLMEDEVMAIKNAFVEAFDLPDEETEKSVEQYFGEFLKLAQSLSVFV